jgi:hypothetical protein
VSDSSEALGSRSGRPCSFSLGLSKQLKNRDLQRLRNTLQAVGGQVLFAALKSRQGSRPNMGAAGTPSGAISPRSFETLGCVTYVTWVAGRNR